MLKVGSSIKESLGSPLLLGTSVCLVEDDMASANVYTRWLEQEGAKVTTCMSQSEFNHYLDTLQRGSGNEVDFPSLLVTDLVLPDGSGLEILENWKRYMGQEPVLVMTAFATVENAVSSFKKGAFDFLRKPFTKEEFVYAVNKALEHYALLKENRSLQSSLHILSMAQTISSYTDRTKMLQMLGRLLFRELSAQMCFVFFFYGNRHQTESLWDSRLPGITRVLPEEIIAKEIAPKLQLLPSPPENYAEVDLSHIRQHKIYENPEDNLVCIELSTPTGNCAYVCLYLKKNSANHWRPELEPVVHQASRTLQSVDVSSALSFVDELTGLYNQRFLEVALTNEIARCNRYGMSVSLLFIDLDKFKSVNDTHGHVVGSTIIREAARVLKSLMRDTDLLLRFGGDEFVVILPNTNLGGAQVLSERICTVFSQSIFDVAEATNVSSAYNISITTSIGVSSLPECADTMQQLIQTADDAMYMSKRNGRNQTSLSKQLITLVS